MVSIRRALAQIKDDWTAFLSEEHLTHIWREAGPRWRDRTLSPVVTIYVFLLRVLHGNTAMTNLPRLSGKRFTPSRLLPGPPAPATCRAAPAAV